MALNHQQTDKLVNLLIQLENVIQSKNATKKFESQWTLMINLHIIFFFKYIGYERWFLSIFLGWCIGYVKVLEFKVCLLLWMSRDIWFRPLFSFYYNAFQFILFFLYISQLRQLDLQPDLLAKLYKIYLRKSL